MVGAADIAVLFMMEAMGLVLDLASKVLVSMTPNLFFMRLQVRAVEERAMNIR